MRKFTEADARRLYAFQDEFTLAYDYDLIIDEIGKALSAEVVDRWDTNDYQGDTLVIYSRDAKFYYLQFGWGSCSGCDALQACETFFEVAKLMNELMDSIKSFDSRDEIAIYLCDHDWEGDYIWHMDGFEQWLGAMQVKYMGKQND
jgi:hypothetical protein